MATMDYEKKISVAPETEILVVGSGPSGLAAAIAAGRSGKTTRIVEQYGFLGGNLTAGMVNPCMTSFSLDGSVQLVRGVFDEFITRLEQQGAAVHPSKTKPQSTDVHRNSPLIQFRQNTL